MASAQILLVEDEKIVARDVQNRLQRMGYTVTAVASSGEEAIQKASEAYPDLVLMDVRLKGEMDGVETSEQLRRRYHVPIIFLTAYADDQTLQRAKLTEPYGFLLKPYEERELYTTIEIALFKHRMERKLQETEQWLAATLRSIGDAVIATDARGCIRMINASAQALTGWTPEEAEAHSLVEVFHLVNEDLEEPASNPITRAVRAGAWVELPPHCKLLNRTGQVIPVEGTVSPIHDAQGNLAGLVLVCRDVTPRQRHEETQRRLDEQLHHAQKMEAIGRLAGGVAHDFNNLLTVMLGNTSMVLSGGVSAEANHECLEAVEQAGLRAADLVRKLQGFARQTRLRLEPMDINHRIHDSLDAIRPMLAPAVSVKLDLAEDIWRVHADATQMHQVLVNLALNAREAMPDGGMLHIATENFTINADSDVSAAGRLGDYACLRVRDTGRGIPPGLYPHIFEPFFTTKGPASGAGLALAMVYGIIEQQNGWIECHTVEPGTRFDIYLPRYGSGVEYVARPETGPGRFLLDVGSERERGSATILLADDEPMLRELGRKVLETQGYQVLCAEDGMQAVEIFQREHDSIDLVLLDLKMPRLSGLDAFSYMRALNPNIHAIILSGFFTEELPAAPHPNVLGYIAKPYHIDDLARLVREALDHVKAASEAPAGASL